MFHALLLPYLILVALLNGCASIHSGQYAQPIDSLGNATVTKNHSTNLGLIVSGQENEKYSNRFFGNIDLTFENTSSKFIRIKSVKLEFNDPKITQSVKIPVGADLVAWSEATQQRNAIRDMNTAMALGAVAAIGGATASLASDSNLRATGATLGAAAAGGLTMKALNSSVSQVELARLVPKTHILADDFVVPPGLHTKKWVTLYLPNPEETPFVQEMYISYTTDDGKSEKVLLPLRDKRTRSEWQAKHPSLIEEPSRSFASINTRGRGFSQ